MLGTYAVFRTLLTMSRGRGGKDLMSGFMELKDQDGNYFSTSWIRDIMLNFLIAGRDTTAILLTWTTYHVVSNPRVYEKLQ